MTPYTPAEIDALDAYTNAQMLKLTRHAIATLMSDPDAKVKIAGREWEVHNLEQLREQEKYYQARVAEEESVTDTTSAGGCPVVRFVRPA